VLAISALRTSLTMLGLNIVVLISFLIDGLPIKF
jgi:hypothetical protein